MRCAFITAECSDRLSLMFSLVLAVVSQLSDSAILFFFDTFLFVERQGFAGSKLDHRVRELQNSLQQKGP